MHTLSFMLRSAVLATVAACLALPATAQLKFPGSRATSASPTLQYSGRSQLGLGGSRMRQAACVPNPLFPCELPEGPGYAYAGSMLGNHWGVELGYLSIGGADRSGAARTQGLNLSLVGRLPVAQSVGLFGRVGTTYGRPDAPAALAAGEGGFGLSYGAGLSLDFSPALSATLGFDSHGLRMPGSARDTVRATSLGLSYRY